MSDGSSEDVRWYALASNPESLPSKPDGYLDFDSEKYKAIGHDGLHKLILSSKEFHEEQKRVRKLRKTTYTVFGVKDQDIKDRVFHRLEEAKRFLISNTSKGYSGLVADRKTQYLSSFNFMVIEWNSEESMWLYYGFKESQIREFDGKLGNQVDDYLKRVSLNV